MLTEKTRTILYALCILGLWFPIPFWWVGASIVVHQLRNSPSSGAKKAMWSLFILSIVSTIVYVVAMLGLSTQPRYYSYYGYAYNSYYNYRQQEGYGITSGIMVFLFCVCQIAFIPVADRVYRSNFGTPVMSTSNMLHLRGVHLGLNISGMLIVPLFSFIGIPLVISALSKRRNDTTGFKQTRGWGYASLALSVLTWILLIIFCTVGATSRYYNDYDDYYCARKRQLMTDANTTVAETFATTGPWQPSPTWYNPTTGTIGWWYATTTAPWNEMPTWDTTTAWYTKQVETWVTTAYGPGACEYNQSYRYSYSSYSTPIIFYVWWILLILALIQWAFNIVFISYGDAMILRLIQADGGALPAGEGQAYVARIVTPGQAVSVAPVVLVHPCASCQSPLQFNRTGPITQVQCYNCHAVVEFTTA